jgi:hypothetical protein
LKHNGKRAAGVKIDVNLKEMMIHQAGRHVSIARVVGPEFDVFSKAYFREDTITIERKKDARTRAQRRMDRILERHCNANDPTGWRSSKRAVADPQREDSSLYSVSRIRGIYRNILDAFGATHLRESVWGDEVPNTTHAFLAVLPDPPGYVHPTNAKGVLSWLRRFVWRRLKRRHFPVFYVYLDDEIAGVQLFLPDGYMSTEEYRRLRWPDETFNMPNVKGLLNKKPSAEEERRAAEAEKPSESDTAALRRMPIIACIAGREGLSTTRLEFEAPSLESIEPHYPVVAWEKLKRFLDDWASGRVLGRLAIIDGDPGVGKTYLLMALARHLERQTLLIASPEVFFKGPQDYYEVLAKIREEENGNGRLLICEDAGSVIGKFGWEPIRSTCLNLTDGMLGVGKDDLFVFTHNGNVLDLDEAATRNGRVALHLTIGKLNPDEQRRFYKHYEVSGSDIDGWIGKESRTLADCFERRFGAGMRNSGSGRDAVIGFQKVAE